jgi:predicted DNA binding CopG/RHH family protein
MNTKLNKIPKFNDMKEEAKFWDKNDISDFLPEMKKVKMVYKKKVNKEEMVVVRVQTDIKNRLEKVADSQGLALSTMLRMWFIDRLKQGINS